MQRRVRSCGGKIEVWLNALKRLLSAEEGRPCSAVLSSPSAGQSHLIRGCPLIVIPAERHRKREPGPMSHGVSVGARPRCRATWVLTVFPDLSYSLLLSHRCE